MSTADPIAPSLADDAQTRRRPIAGSLWPRARLLAQILWHQIERDRIFTQASALTYKTLFSLLPIFVLSLLVLSAIGGKERLDTSVKQVLFQQIGLDQLTITDDHGKPMLNAQGHEITIASYAERFISRANESISNAATGLVAFAVLLYGAISLMIVIETTFNQIYGSTRPRTWLRRLMLYWCVLTLGPIGVAASIALGQSAYSHASASFTNSAWLLSTANVITSFAVSWLLILLLYRIVPDTRVHWRSAALGAFLAAFSWEIGKWAFGLYFQLAVKNNVYGSLALLPLFMFWIYITWTLLLIGLEVTYIKQFWPLLKRRFFFMRHVAPGGTAISDMRWVLSLGVLLCKQFQAGKLTETHEAAEKLMLSSDVSRALLEGLEKAGLVHEVKPGVYSLARPPESITAHDLLTAARALCQIPPELAKEPAHVSTYPASSAMRDLEHIEEAWAKEHTLAQLAQA